MTREEITQTSADVIPAVAKFLSRYDLKTFTTQTPAIIQGMFNNLMSTEFGDNRQYRERLLVILLLCEDLSETLAPFTETDFKKALTAY